MIFKCKTGGWEDLKLGKGLSVLSPCHQLLLKYYHLEPKLSQEVQVSSLLCMRMCNDQSSRTPYSFVPSQLCGYMWVKLSVWCPGLAGQFLTDSKEDHILKNIFDGMCYLYPARVQWTKMTLGQFYTPLLACMMCFQGFQSFKYLCVMGLNRN